MGEQSVLIFISSRMREFEEERQQLPQLLEELDFGNIKFRTWVFERDAPATSNPIRDVCEQAVRDADLYLGIFGRGYGEWTIEEFRWAENLQLPRHVYVLRNRATDLLRNRQLVQFLREISDVETGITYKEWKSRDDLGEKVRDSLEKWIENRFRRPCDESATLLDQQGDVPNVLDQLIGYEDFVEQLVTTVNQHGKVLLQGFGGSGKTAIAAQAAYNWLVQDADRKAIWIKVGGEGEDFVLEAIARGFGKGDEIRSLALESKVRQVQAMLQDSGAGLLVIDDAWNGRTLARLLSVIPPRTMGVIVTSRERFPVLPIKPIKEPDEQFAIKILEYYAGGKDYSSDPAARELCDLVGNLPFAIKILGSMIKTTESFPADVLKEIQKNPASLEVPADFIEDKFQKGIVQILQFSLSTLDDDTQQALEAFGALLAPTNTPNLVASYLHKPAENVTRSFRKLIQKGLMSRTANPNVYEIHDLTYSYLRALFEARGANWEAVFEAINAYAVANPELVNTVLPNILNAMSFAQQKNKPEYAVKLATILAMEGFLDAQIIDDIYEGDVTRTALHEQLDEAIAIARSLPEYKRELHYLLGKRGNIYAHLREYNSAIRFYEEALVIAQELKITERVVLLMTILSRMHVRLKEMETAEQYLQSALRIARGKGASQRLQYIALDALGYHHYIVTADKGQAYNYYQQALAVATAANNDEYLFLASLNLGVVEQELEKFAEAQTHLKTAQTIADRCNKPRWQADVLLELGKLDFRRENFDDAREKLYRTLTLYEHVQYLDGISETLEFITNETQFNIPPAFTKYGRTP